MGWTITEDLAAYSEAAGEFLLSDPIRHTVLITVLDRLRRQGQRIYGDEQPHFGWWTTPGGEVGGAFFRTPPFGIVLSPLPSEAVDPLVRDYAAVYPSLPGVSGPAAAAQSFANSWARSHGTAVTPGRTDRLYRLGELTPPDPAPEGTGRLADTRDRELLSDWFVEFAGIIGDPPPPDPGRMIDDRLSHRGLTLWELDGTPVSMAGSSAIVAGALRIAPVFTPKPLRGKGFAAAATTQACRHALASGARHITLFADITNPTSNALYQRLGFHPLADYSTIRLA